MTPVELIELWNNSSSDDSDGRRSVFSADDYFDGWEVAEDDDWTQDHKYQHCTRVIKHTVSGRCFSVSASRSGSYHTDWYYSYDDMTEVKAVSREVTQTITEWVAV